MIIGISGPVRPLGWLALLAACATSGACSSKAPLVPDAFVAATIGPGVNGAACNIGSTQQWLDIGTGTADMPTTAKDGSKQANGPVQVSCTVSASGNGFNLLLNATQEGTGGGSLTVTSPSGPVTTSTGTGLTGVFDNGSFGTYSDENCTLSYTYLGKQVPDQPPIAGGRIWGHISCPHAQTSGKTVPSPDGGIENVQCDGEADFLFEECGQ